MDVVVTEDQLALAIGKGGQNVRLASELSGWQLNIMTTEEREQKSEAETSVVRALFMEKLDVDEEVAEILVAEGFTSLDKWPSAHQLVSDRSGSRGDGERAASPARNALLTEAIKSD